MFLEGGKTPMAICTAVTTLIPLGVAYDAAAASSDCDLLINSLADKRKEGPCSDAQYELAIRRIELILDRENT